MGRWREAATDALAMFAASRLIVLAALLWPPTQVHAYLTTWDAGFYLDIARCGYDPACGAARRRTTCPRSSLCSRSPRASRARVGISQAWGGAALAALASLAALILLHRLCSELRGRRTALLACAAVSFFPFSYVLSTNYSEGFFLLASIGAFTAARSRHPALAFLAGLAAGFTRPAAIPLALGLGADALLAPERRRASLAGAAGAVAGVVARLRRPRPPPRRLAREPARPADRLEPLDQRHRRPRGARALRPRGDHARARPEPALPDRRAAGRDRLWRALAHGIRDGMFVFAVIAVAAPLATGSAMSLPRFLMGTFPYASPAASCSTA